MPCPIKEIADRRGCVLVKLAWAFAFGLRFVESSFMESLY